ncbi:MAG: hypothetical protein WBP12_01460 [Candidatus Saccharimonas sp.]
MKRQVRERTDFSKLPPDQRQEFAEHLRERIYATLTLLAVMVVLWQHPDEHGVWGVIGIIVGTVVALWLATIIAARMSYRMVHDTSELEPKFREVVSSASGLLAPAGVPVFFVLLAMLQVVSMKWALSIGILSLILSLFFFSLYAGRKSSDSLMKILLYSILQMALGVGVVLLKLALE